MFLIPSLSHGKLKKAAGTVHNRTRTGRGFSRKWIDWSISTALLPMSKNLTQLPFLRLDRCKPFPWHPHARGYQTSKFKASSLPLHSLCGFKHGSSHLTDYTFLKRITYVFLVKISTEQSAVIVSSCTSFFTTITYIHNSRFEGHTPT